MSSLSVVINTLNSEATLKLCLESVKNLGQIIVVDMHSDDGTVDIARQYTDKIFLHDRTGYVEPARNYAISKAETDWVLILDSDEEISTTLAKTIEKIINNKFTLPENTDYTHVYFPRKNIIFGRWMQHSGWWPDEKLRLFKKGTVIWKNEIHSEPEATGSALHLTQEDQNAIIHHHYTSVSQWVQRMDKYSTVQANELHKSEYIFEWRDLIRKPLSEFITRFYVWEGWKDGTLGLSLSLLQALSWVVVYLKVRELQIGQKYKEIPDQNFLQQFGEECDKAENEIGFYMEKLGLQSQLKRWIQRVLP